MIRYALVIWMLLLVINKSYCTGLGGRTPFVTYDSSVITLTSTKNATLVPTQGLNIIKLPGIATACTVAYISTANALEGDNIRIRSKTVGKTITFNETGNLSLDSTTRALTHPHDFFELMYNATTQRWYCIQWKDNQ